jgi:hypothetical protein
LAEALRNEPGLDVKLVDGDRGELSVIADGRVVAKKGLFFMPSTAKVLAAVRQTQHAGTS